MEYQGWTLFDKVLIVAKKLGHWDYDQDKWVEDPDYQGYIVDPSNKQMLKSAQAWAETCRTKYDENGKFCGYDRTPGEEFLYDNGDFRLQLLETAGRSSQGGKLSFWNCWVTAPDGKKFKVGISADLLLELLLQSVFDNGRCTCPLCFVRRKEGVGMLNTDMESYQNALRDMQRKADVKTKKTSKHQLGHAYTALQAANAYAGDIWVWYEPIYEPYVTGTGWSRQEYDRLVGYKKLAEPKHLYWFPSLYHFEEGKTFKASELGLDHWNIKEGKLPARIDSGACLEFDITLEERIDRAWRAEIESDKRYYDHFNPSSYDPIGWGASKDGYEMPEELRKAIIDAGYKIVD